MALRCSLFYFREKLLVWGLGAAGKEVHAGVLSVVRILVALLKISSLGVSFTAVLGTAKSLRFVMFLSKGDQSEPWEVLHNVGPVGRTKEGCCSLHVGDVSIKGGYRRNRGVEVRNRVFQGWWWW